MKGFILLGRHRMRRTFVYICVQILDITSDITVFVA